MSSEMLKFLRTLNMKHPIIYLSSLVYIYLKSTEYSASVLSISWLYLNRGPYHK